MKFQKSSRKICLVAVTGFLLGAVWSHSPIAQAQTGASTTITPVAVDGVVPRIWPTRGRVVGFSCIISPTGGATCYVATQ
jgi:hypothetical protein